MNADEKTSVKGQGNSNLTPTLVHRPVDLQGLCDIFHVMEIMMIKSKCAERAHFWPKVRYKDRVDWVYNLNLASIPLSASTEEKN
jgi:hypothetical protein